MKRPTMSSADRLLSCPSSFALPSNEPPNAYVGGGNAVHQYLHDLHSMSAAEALDRAPAEHRVACAEIPLARLPFGPGYTAEESYAYDASTDGARFLGAGLEREYGELAPFEVAGTADVVGVFGDHVEVIDYKGHDPSVAHPRSNAQLHLLALAACRFHGVERARVVIHRYHTGWQDEAWLDAIDLQIVAGKVKAGLVAANVAAAKVKAGDPVDTSPGGHCRYCPAKLACPSMVGALSLVARDDHEQLASPRIVTKTDLSKAIDLRARIKAMDKLLDGAINTACREGMSVELDGGKVYGLHEYRKRETLNGGVAATVLAERGHDALELVDLKITKTALKKLGAKECRAVLDEMRERGGVTGGGVGMSVGEYAPKVTA